MGYIIALHICTASEIRGFCQWVTRAQNDQKSFREHCDTQLRRTFFLYNFITLWHHLRRLCCTQDRVQRVIPKCGVFVDIQYSEGRHTRSRT